MNKTYFYSELSVNSLPEIMTSSAVSTTNRPITDSEKIGGKLGLRHQSPTIQESVTDEETALGNEISFNIFKTYCVFYEV